MKMVSYRSRRSSRLTPSMSVLCLMSAAVFFHSAVARNIPSQAPDGLLPESRKADLLPRLFPSFKSPRLPLDASASIPAAAPSDPTVVDPRPADTGRMSQSSAAVTPAVPAGVPSTSPPISNPAAGTPGNPPIPNSPGGTPANTPASLATGTAVNTPASNPVSGTPVNAPVTSPVSGTSQNTPASNPAGGTSANAPQPSSPPASTGSRPGSDPNSDHTSDHTSGNSGHTNMTSANGPFATKARILTLSEAMALVADHPQKAMLAAPIFLFICIVGMFLSYIVTLYQSTFPHATWNASLDAAGKYVEHKESDASIVYARKPTTNARSVKHDDDEGRMGGKLVHKSSLTRLPSKSRPRYQTAAAAAAAAGGSNNTDNSQHLAPWERKKSRQSVLVAAQSSSGLVVVDPPTMPTMRDYVPPERDEQQQRTPRRMNTETPPPPMPMPVRIATAHPSPAVVYQMMSSNPLAQGSPLSHQASVYQMIPSNASAQGSPHSHQASVYQMMPSNASAQGSPHSQQASPNRGFPERGQSLDAQRNPSVRSRSPGNNLGNAQRSLSIRNRSPGHNLVNAQRSPSVRSPSPGHALVNVQRSPSIRNPHAADQNVNADNGPQRHLMDMSPLRPVASYGNNNQPSHPNYGKDNNLPPQQTSHGNNHLPPHANYANSNLPPQQANHGITNLPPHANYGNYNPFADSRAPSRQAPRSRSPMPPPQVITPPWGPPIRTAASMVPRVGSPARGMPVVHGNTYNITNNNQFNPAPHPAYNHTTETNTPYNNPRSHPIDIPPSALVTLSRSNTHTGLRRNNTTNTITSTLARPIHPGSQNDPRPNLMRSATVTVRRAAYMELPRAAPQRTQQQPPLVLPPRTHSATQQAPLVLPPRTHSAAVSSLVSWSQHPRQTLDRIYDAYDV